MEIKKPMKNKIQKIGIVIFVFCLIVLSLESLAVILNLYQIQVFLHLAFWLWLFLWLLLFMLYDLHFKNFGVLKRAIAKHESVPRLFKRVGRIVVSAIFDRLSHLRKWEEIKHWLNYLLLPGFLFWSTVGILYVNFGNTKVQQIYIWLSSVALALIYWFVKQVFSKKQEKVEANVFMALSVVKIYSIALAYAVAMAIMRHFCLDPFLFVSGVFSLTFLHIYQALFQHKYIQLFSLGITSLISAVMAILGYFVYVYWGYNFYTAAILLTAFYNLFWGIYHYYLDKALTKKIFFEIILLCFFVIYIVLSNTNFKAKIFGGCVF